MKIKAILFAVIGTTIVETNPSVITECFKDAFSHHHVQISDSEIESIRGKDKQESIELLLQQKGHSFSDAPRILESFKNNFKSRLNNFSEAEDLHDVIGFFR